MNHNALPGDAPIEHVVHSHHLTFVQESAFSSDIPVDVELRYDTRDPFAVTARFGRQPGETIWLFSRELLAEGLIEPAGEADVRIGPCTRTLLWVKIELRAPSGEASFVVRSDELSDFLDCTYAMVPPGEEQLWIDFDFELHRLVSG
ncbi:SsgA family sporulation/cell division regulator [Amycolatopsis thailandensis]|uniref:SsgA family sporulation/cell division regulator n=1 Tax=Amycolatopsis thailandensis TaxID=589330 RepID=UPI00363CB5B9